jgi:hypothetical protein
MIAPGLVTLVTPRPHPSTSIGHLMRPGATVEKFDVKMIEIHDPWYNKHLLPIYDPTYPMINTVVKW